MAESTFLTSIKSYFRCCCLKRDDDQFMKNNCSIDPHHVNNYTFDDLALPDTPPYNLNTSLSNSSSSDWSISSSSSPSSPSNDYNRDYRVFSTNIHTTVGRRSVFDPFLTS